MIYERLTKKKDRPWTLSLEMLNTELQHRADKYLSGEMTIEEVSARDVRDSLGGLLVCLP